MNPLASTAVLAVASGAAVALRDGSAASFAPPAEKWWTAARDKMRLVEGIPGQRGQTLVKIHETMVARAKNAVGPNPLDKSLPDAQTHGTLAEHCRNWLGAVTIWQVGLADAEVPAAYTALQERLAIHSAFSSVKALPNQAVKTWRAMADYAHTADAMRFKGLDTGVSGDHASGFWDYVGLGADRTWDVAVDSSTWLPKLGIDEAEARLKALWPKILPLLLKAALIGGAVWLLYEAVKPHLPKVPSPSVTVKA